MKYLPPELQGLPCENDIQHLAASSARAGTWAEFGVAGGSSAKRFIKLMPENTQIHLFDSFKGLPEEWDFNGDINKIGRYAEPKPLEIDDPRVHIHTGMFADVLPKTDIGICDFVHIDCDLYSSTKTVFEYLKVKSGTIILFDEYQGYAEYKNHERKAYMEWSKRTDNQLRWLAYNRSEALGIVI